MIETIKIIIFFAPLTIEHDELIFIDMRHDQLHVLVIITYHYQYSQQNEN